MTEMTETSELKGRAAFIRDLKLIPNLLCVYRLIAITISVGLFFSGYKLTGLLLGITAGLTDYLDGYLARKWNQCTELGALLDGMADLLFAFMCLICAVWIGVWPLYTLVLWGLRDIGVTFLRASAAQQGFAIRSTFMAKVASNFNFYAFVVMALDAAKPFGSVNLMADIIHWIGLGAIHIGILLQWISGSAYLNSYIEQYRPLPLGSVADDSSPSS